MNYIKKSLITFGLVLMALFGIKAYISTKNFKGNLTKILKASGLNVEFDKVRLERFNKIKIDNLKVKDNENKVVIDAKNTTASLNLLMPSRLFRIEINNAVVNLERRKDNDFNIFHVLKPSDKKTPIDNTNRIGKLYFRNSTLNYSDTSFGKKIEKTLTDVEGFLEASKSRGFSMEAKGSSADESLKIKLSQLVSTEQSILSMFDTKKNSSEDRKEFRLAFEFDNVAVTEELGQYIPLDMISAKGGRLTGKLALRSRPKDKTMQAAGNLDVKSGILRYTDFDGDIENVDANISLGSEKIIVKAVSKLQDRPVTFNMDYGVEKQDIRMKLTTDSVPFSEIAKYRLIKEAGIKGTGDITSELDVYVETKNKTVTLDGKFESPQFALGGQKFRNLKTEMKMDREQVLTLENTVFHFDETYSGFRVKNDVSVPKFTYDVKNKNGGGSYTVTNRGSDYTVKVIMGKASIDENNLINGDFHAEELAGSYVINLKNSVMTVNAEANRNIGLKYGGQSYSVKPKIDLNIGMKDSTMSGNISMPSLEAEGYRFSNIKTGIAINKDQVLTLENGRFHFDSSVNGFKVKSDVNVSRFAYDIKNKKGTASYTLVNRGSDFSVGQISGTASIDASNVIGLNFTSDEINGNAVISTENSRMTLNTAGKKDVRIKYNNETYVVNPKIDNLVLDFKSKDVLVSGNIDTSLKIPGNKFLDAANAKISIGNGKYSVIGAATIGGEKISVRGATTKDMVHSYTVSSAEKPVDIARLLRKYSPGLKGLKNAELPSTFTARINGKGSSISGTYELASQYGEYIVEYEELYAKGKITDLLSLNLDADVKINELWLGYQRFKELSGNLNIKDNMLTINNVHNDKLYAQGNYNLKDGKMKIDSNLKNYVVYNTAAPEMNLYIDNLSANLSGTLDRLSGEIAMTPSKTTIDSRYAGDAKVKIDVDEGVLNFTEARLRNNEIAGTYNLKNGIADISMKLDEKNVPDLFEFKDLTFGTSAMLNLKGDLNDFDLTGEISLDNMSFKTYKIPQVKTNIEYTDGNVDKLFKYGTFNVKELVLLGDNREELFRTNTKFDLENIDIDYKLENQNFVLDSVQDLKDKGYSGEVNLDFVLKGKPEDFSTELRMKSDKLTLSGFPVEDLDVDLSATNKSLNIGQFYLEYEKNPLLVTGNIDFLPMKYNISILAQNFNLGFLGVNPDVKNAKGIGNVDILMTSAQTDGKIKLDDFYYQTKDGKTDVNNLFADINIDSKKLYINRLDGGYNGGTFKAEGDLDIPAIPEDFVKTKRVELGRIDINAELNRVGVKYGEDIDLTLSGDLRLTENNLFGNIIVNSGEIRAVPDFSGGNEKQAPEKEKAQKLQDKTIVEGVVEEVIDKIMKQYTVNIDVQSPGNLKIDIPSVSLVKTIKGELIGGSKINYENGQLGMIGDYYIRGGSFLLNNRKFKIERAEIRFTEQNDKMSGLKPFVIFDASTKVKGETIEISMNGYMDNPDIAFRSSSGLTKEQILSVLAFNTSTADSEKSKSEAEDGNLVISSVTNTLLNELIFSPVTGKIGETLGLSNVSISTDISKSGRTGGYGGATTLYIQDNIYKERLFWNLEVKFPFEFKNNSSDGVNSDSGSTPLGYNAWLNYNILNGLEVKLGGETITKSSTRANSIGTSERKKSQINYYIGVDFSKRADSFEELWKKIFRRKKLDVLTK